MLSLYLFSISIFFQEKGYLSSRFYAALAGGRGGGLRRWEGAVTAGATLKVLGPADN